MAFEIITGTYTSANDIIDALAANWDFDSEDTSSSAHSVTWGTSRIYQTGGEIALEVNGSIPTNAGIVPGTGTYRIYKTSNGLICDVNNIGAVAVTTSKNVDDETDVLKISALVSSRVTSIFIAGGTGYLTHNYSDFIKTTSSTAMQVIPYLHTYGGYKANNLYLMRVASATTLNNRYYIGDDLFYVFKGFAIKEE